MKPRGRAPYIYIAGTFHPLRINQKKRWKREKWRWKRVTHSCAFSISPILNHDWRRLKQCSLLVTLSSGSTFWLCSHLIFLINHTTILSIYTLFNCSSFYSVFSSTRSQCISTDSHISNALWSCTLVHMYHVLAMCTTAYNEWIKYVYFGSLKMFYFW